MILTISTICSTNKNCDSTIEVDEVTYFESDYGAFLKEMMISHYE